MKLTREFLDSIAQNAGCCLSNISSIYHNRLRTGLDTKCIEDEALLLNTYLEIISKYHLDTDSCTCSLLGKWEAESDFFGNGTVYFYPGNIGRWYVDFDSFIEFTYLQGEAFIEISFYNTLTDEEFEFILYPDSLPLLGDDCTTFTGYNAQESGGVVAFAEYVDLDGKFFQPFIVINGVTVFSTTFNLNTSVPPSQLLNHEISMQEFADLFNAQNTLGYFMDTAGEQQGFVIYAPSTGTSFNGTVVQLYQNVTRSVGQLTLVNGEDPVDAAFSMTLVSRDPAGECCVPTNCVTETQLKDIINHVSKICSLYKCC